LRVSLAQQLFKVLKQQLWSCVIEHPGQRWILRGHGHHDPVQADGFGAVGQFVEGLAELQQHLSNRTAFLQKEELAWQARFARGLHRSGEQRLLVLEMTIERELGNPGFGGDSVHAAALVTVVEKQALRGGEDRLALGGILWSAGARWSRQIFNHGIRLILDWLVWYFYYTGQYKY